MNLLESIRIAIRSLTANKMRAILTMLGIIIGVMAVIAMMSIGRGAQATIINQIQSIGTNLLFIRPGAVRQEGVAAAQGSAATLTLEDADALVGIPDVLGVAPEVQGGVQVVYLGTNANARLLGVTPEYADIMNVTLASGEFFTNVNIASRSTVAILGSQLATTLFSDLDPIGQMIRLNNQNFRVIGVLAPRGGTGFMNVDMQVLVPLTTATSRLTGRDRFRGQNNVNTVNVKITDPSAQDAVVQDISAILRERHRVLFQDDFQIQSQQDILNTASQITGTLTIFLGGIAAISLLVGGIGIMNIMLVSVTERTREIGIRKAIGARRADILIQFLTEAIILSVSGGVIGVMFGALIARMISGISMGTSTLNTVVDLDSVLLAVGFSVGVGLFFGIYPANRAANLHPIDALRYE